MSLLHQRGGEIQAERIKEAIAEGQNIDLYRVRIIGNLELSNKQARRESNSSEVEVLFEEQMGIASIIRFNYCIFEGSVSFPNTVFFKEVSFAGSHFERDAVFWPGPTEFQREVDFFFTNFYRTADFSYVKFKDNVTFKEAVFRKDGHQQAEFSHTIFDREVEFVGTIFGGKAVFLGSRFRDIADFSSNTRFYEDAQFDDARFYETPWFYDCKFQGNAEFNHVTFYRDAIFSHSSFNKDFKISGSMAGIIYLEGFENRLLLKSESRIGISDIREISELIDRLHNGQDPISQYIKNKFSCEMKTLISAFDTTIQLDSASRVKFLNEFNEIIFSKSFLAEKPFRSLKLSEITEILNEQGDDDPRLNRLILEDAYPDLIIKNETLFGVKLNSGSRILLEGSYFNLLKIHWHILKKYLDKDTTPSVYISLIGGYRELGWTKDEDDCYFYYRSLRDKNRVSKAADKLYNKVLNHLNLSKYLDPIASISCGYGVRPTRTLLLSLTVILAYASLFWIKCTFWLSLGGDGLVYRTYLSANVAVIQLSDRVFQTIYAPINQMAGPSLLDSIYFIPNSLYLSAMIFISQVPSNWYINGYWKYIVMSERVLGWLLMALFIVVLTKKLIR